MPHDAQRTEFDHAVVMVRDRLQDLAPGYERQGYTLSETATHNLGSWNRLIVLEGGYVELLGWPPGVVVARQEIANSPMGLEALVLRTHDAEATYERLRGAGYAVNPVQVLTRPALVDGKQVEVRFHTVRFAEQPVPGLRMYFCRHLTPEYVWMPALMRHANDARSVVQIDARSADPQQTAARIADIAAVPVEQAADGWNVLLGNATLHVAPDHAGAGTGLVSLTLERGDASRYVMDIAP
jgi:hypothetical protein